MPRFFMSFRTHHSAVGQVIDQPMIQPAVNTRRARSRAGLCPAAACHTAGRAEGEAAVCRGALFTRLGA